MKRLIFAFLFLFSAIAGYAQDAAIKPMLDVEEVEPPVSKETRVTAVYGISADDYLPMKNIERARQHLRPKVRGRASRPAFNLPDAFYFIGGPIFLLLFLRVLVIFLNGFEEKRREEQRAAASEKTVEELPLAE
ncbi:hypothetical protein [Pontiella sulfatireligans]|nr:hypothetical protein [Pontiella sulfatireligans]